MRNRRSVIVALMCAVLALPAGAVAQNSSINTYSPYSFYGLGDFSVQGTANLRSMGGAGTAYRDTYSINYLNPASYSVIRQRSALFNVGMEGQNFYLKSSDKESSYNTFNIRDVAFSIPLGKGIGFGISITPLSSVGYRIATNTVEPTDGQINYLYSGEGDINQLKAGIGWEVIPNLSLGAEMVYYFGNIYRYAQVEIYPLMGSDVYREPTLTMSENVARILPNFGAQYNLPLSKGKKVLTLGATYQLKTKLKPQVIRSLPTSDGTNIYGEYIDYQEYTDTDLTMPGIMSAGAFYQTSKMSIGADYTFQGWASANKKDRVAGEMQLRNTSTLKAGMQYTPDRGDIRNLLKRVTYRFGLRYGDYYMSVRGEDISDKAVTLGFGIPMRMNGFSNLDVGVELGQRGTTSNNLIKENYFKFSIGFSLFGEDYWFVKRKYD